MIRILLLFGFSVIASFSYSQLNNQGAITTEDLDFYLLQSFLAGDTKSRIALNHIGIQVRYQNSEYLITAVLEGYPAHAAGIERGDIIQTVDSEPFHPIHSFNVEQDSYGAYLPTTRAHELRVQRGNSTSAITLRPVFENLFDSYRSATANSVLEFSAGNKIIGYIRFWALSRSTSDMINYQELLSSLDHCDGIIFDLRNSFGFLDSQHLDLVFNDKENYFTVSEPADLNFNFAEISPNLEFNNYRKPIAVLLNEDTQGGPELFAYQLDKLERVVSLGSATPGRIGSFFVERSADATSINYRAAQEILIDGKRFEDVGNRPEIEVPFPYESTTRGDPQYDAAVNALLGII
ncbi:MAG: hypothetical protein GKR91_11105 [Pseudomonadales bacterium]|nr:hypothetical protein [Pseudomonadales bacterium]